MTNLASIDIGSHTARLLVAQKIGTSGTFRPLVRERAYIRLAEGFDEVQETIKPEAIDRTLDALGEFVAITREFNVIATRAVSTGVVRRAGNRDQFLNLIHSRTGIKAQVISGEEEAQLTMKGVLHSLDIQGEPFTIFDLGGGSTEFIFSGKENTEVKSTPLGTMTLKQRFLKPDPPEAEGIEALLRFVDGVLLEALPKEDYSGDDSLLVGTGGTVTTLAAMIYGIDIKDITADRMNGLILRKERLEDLFERIKMMTIAERLKLPGLDRGRADVIVPGSVVVLRILHFFRSLQLVVSLSDLLEGILIAELEASP